MSLRLVDAASGQAPRPFPEQLSKGAFLVAVIPTVLTFDDGPHAATKENYTAAALGTLRERGMKGAFFVQTHVGYRGGSTEGEKLIRRLHEEGHVVGIHTGSAQDHVRHTVREREGLLGDDLARASKRLEALGIRPRFVRPVQGVCDAPVLEQYEEAGLKLVHWDVDSRDSARGYTPDRIAAHLKESFSKVGAKSHVVVLFHELDPDTRGQIVRYIDVMVSAATDAGHSLRFPTTRQEVMAFFEARSDEGVCLRASQAER